MLTGSNRAKDLELILNVVKTINKSLILDEVLQLVLDNAIKVAKAERGFLILQTEEKELRCVLARDARGHSLPDDAHQISDTIVHDVFTTAESICVENAQTDDRYEQRQSIMSLQLETILCSPLVVRNEKIGVIYVDSRSIQPVNRDEIVDLFEILAGQAAIAIKNAKLYDTLQTAFHDIQIANEQLIKSERMVSKGEMAAEISHELKNLVNVVLLQLQSLSRTMSKNPALEKSPEHQKLKNSIVSVERIGEFAKGLLESSPLQVEKTKGDFNGHIKHVVKFIKTLKRYEKATIQLKFDEKIPAFPFDKKQIHQVLLNLLNNSVEAYNEATIRIETQYYPAKHYVRFVVSDNGPGIEQGVLKKLLKSKITTKPDGHGYGLPICRKIIENHGGTMEVESAVNQGAAFFMTLSMNENYVEEDH
ncbi:MAG TPA: ATP-binding protein [Bacteroidales bacterium]|nr:ATP-binding protein [Bacteroidales bacterium]